MKNKQGRGKREEGGIGRRGKEEREKREEYLREKSVRNGEEGVIQNFLLQKQWVQ